MMRLVLALLATLSILPLAAHAQDEGPLHVTITDGVIEPLPFAIAGFIPETGNAGRLASQIASVISNDLTGTGLFRKVPRRAFIQNITSFDQKVSYSDWQAINAQALVVGSVARSGGKVVVRFRLFDIFSGQQMGDGRQLAASPASWRRLAHKVADVIYSRITGEGPYFDSRLVFVSESGPKNNRQKRLTMMDYDGANVNDLTDSATIVLAPRFSRSGDKVIYTTFETGFPRIKILDVATASARLLPEIPGTMTFSPRFSPDGTKVVYSMEQNGNTDLWMMNVSSGQTRRLTTSPAIETSPSFSPDGSRIVFESDRSGRQQLYVMAASGGNATRISFGEGRYSTPVWSPRGDMIAFTKKNAGRFHIGVMRTDGSEERLLTSSFLDEGPAWSPNGRVIMFTRETPGARGEAALYSVDISGRNLKKVPTPGPASDPAWSPLLP